MDQIIQPPSTPAATGSSSTPAATVGSSTAASSTPSTGVLPQQIQPTTALARGVFPPAATAGSSTASSSTPSTGVLPQQIQPTTALARGVFPPAATAGSSTPSTGVLPQQIQRPTALARGVLPPIQPPTTAAAAARPLGIMEFGNLISQRMEANVQPVLQEIRAAHQRRHEQFLEAQRLQQQRREQFLEAQRLRLQQQRREQFLEAQRLQQQKQLEQEQQQLAANPSLSSGPICRFFYNDGYCQEGVICKFKHSTEELKRHQTMMHKTRLCFYVKTGLQCPYPNCEFAHNAAEIQQRPQLYKTSMCRHYPPCPYRNCRFAHSREELQPPK